MTQDNPSRIDEPMPEIRGYRLARVVGAGGMSTVYRAFDELAAAGELVPSDEIPPGSLDELASGDPHRVAAELFNALQPAALALYPELADTLALGERPGVLASLVCGSGPTTWASATFG